MFHQIVFNRITLSLILFSLLPGYAFTSECEEPKIKLQDYEPNTIVVRKDNNDEYHFDFVISQMYPILHDGCEGNLSAQSGWFIRPYFAFTGQFGFYALGERNSSPVLGKRFNPKLFMRHWIGEKGIDGYVDFGYAHESNGQSINTEERYLQKREEFLSQGERADFANDYLSRGWDYLDFTLKVKNENESYYTASAYLKLKYFLEDGWLQGKAEEAYSWETHEEKKRSEFDGISLLLKSSTIKTTETAGAKIALTYTTGYKNIFKNNTIKAETTIKIADWPPVLFWISSGYNSDLSDYYKNITSVGIGFEFRNFLKDI